MINANLVNHTQFPEKQLMILMLGVCKALKAMHQYKVKGGAGGAKSVKEARKIRENASRADREAAGAAAHDDDDEIEQPLMEDEITASQDGVAPGQQRAYAHRDIKPGTFGSSSIRWTNC